MPHGTNFSVFLINARDATHDEVENRRNKIGLYLEMVNA